MSDIKSVLLILLSYSSVQSFDWCPLIKPNGVYGGLGFYHRFADYGAGQYVMFNKAGSEWKVKFRSVSDLTLTLIENSVESVEDKGIVNKFGTFALFEASLKKPGGRPRDCSVITYGKKYQILCRDAKQKVITGYNSSGSTSFVILKVRAKEVTKEQAECLIFYKDSTNKSDYFGFNPFQGVLHYDCKNSTQNNCRVPLFIQEIDDSLFAQIDAIVDFSLKKGPSGHLILYNIAGQPKYCTTLEDQPLSDQCKTPENMKTLFVECFSPKSDEVLSSAVPMGSADKNNTAEENSSLSGLTIAVIVSIVVVIVLAVIVLAVVCHRRRNLEVNKDQVTDSVSAKPTKDDPPKDSKKRSGSAIQSKK